MQPVAVHRLADGQSAASDRHARGHHLQRVQQAGPHKVHQRRQLGVAALFHHVLLHHVDRGAGQHQAGHVAYGLGGQAAEQPEYALVVDDIAGRLPERSDGDI